MRSAHLLHISVATGTAIEIATDAATDTMMTMPSERCGKWQIMAIRPTAQLNYAPRHPTHLCINALYCSESSCSATIAWPSTFRWNFIGLATKSEGAPPIDDECCANSFCRVVSVFGLPCCWACLRSS